ncbi:hypothetical protein [Pseudooceanicola nanhaiensis]|uniref:hypothetical protein n=1 Tax=Pseudooceanicola nanhaiensis TaxID=375761 RepID=UPI001CD38A22|nr:hypothetical protein [Pseudooceanicola nanhaiensis]MCA0922857.1 hypothetical protein [Pseudooceanicola nanhaiensis]
MQEFKVAVLSAAVLFAVPAFAGNQTTAIAVPEVNLNHDANAHDNCKGRNCVRGARSWKTSAAAPAPVSKGRNAGRRARPMPEALQTFAQK